MSEISKENDFYDSLSIYNINFIIKYIYDNYIQFILLIAVFFIIYVVDRINHYNNMLFGMTQIPGIPGLSQPQTLSNNIPQISKKSNKKRKK